MGCLAGRTLDRARAMACLAGGMKGFALQMPCLAGQTFVPAGQTLVPAFKTKGFFLQKTLFSRGFLCFSKSMQNNLEFWAAFHRIYKGNPAFAAHCLKEPVDIGSADAGEAFGKS